MITHREHDRQSIRAPGFDYRDPGTYFVTICTQNREHLFGEIRQGVMELSEMGRIVIDCIERIPRHFPGITIDTYVVMPNHVHILVHIDDPPDARRQGRSMLRPNARNNGQHRCGIDRSTCKVIGRNYSIVEIRLYEAHQ